MFVTVVAVLCHLAGPATGGCVEEIVTDSNMTPEITFQECMKGAQAPLAKSMGELVTGGPPVRGGGGMPQRIVTISVPASVLRITEAG
jgi:hypothetical protein